MTQDLEAGGEHRRRLARSTAIFSLATALSRVLGLVREIVESYYFGARGAINAFTIAFQIPNLVRVLVADAALQAAFVPVFTEMLEKGERARAWRLASTLFWLLLLSLSGLTAIFVLVAPFLMPLLTAEYDDLTVRLSQLLFPIVALLGVSGIVVGILNSYEHFTVPALSPVAWNLVIIAGLVIGVPRATSESAELYVYAGSIVIGTIVQVLLPIPWLRGRDGRLQVLLDWRDPALRRVLTLMVPVTLSLGLINLNAVIGTFVAASLIDATIAPKAIDKAFRVYMLPQGVFSVAVATVLFPVLSRLAARADWDGFRGMVETGLRQIIFLLLPGATVTLVLAEPITRILFERGDFEPDQTPVVAGALAAFSFGLVFNGIMLLFNRAFFGLQSPHIPTLVAAGNLVLNTVLYVALYRVGVWGIPLAISLANGVGAAVLVYALRRRLGRLGLGRTAGAGMRMLVGAAALAVVSYGVWYGLDELLGRGFLGQVVSLGAALAAGGVTYLGVCRALGVRELESLLSLRARRR